MVGSAVKFDRKFTALIHCHLFIEALRSAFFLFSRFYHQYGESFFIPKAITRQ
jgi:hypothetical protein